jgi:hypothetical protein
MRSFVSIAVLAALLLTSCAGGDSVGVGTTATTLSDAESATTSPSPPATGSVTLRGDGLGVVQFGQDADEVISVLEVLIGSRPGDAGSQAGWVEYVGWGDLGLFVGFDTPAAEGFTGSSRFVGWEYFGSDGTTFVTAEGAGIGTVYPELQALYGDRLEVSTAPDECVSGTAYPFVLGGSVFGLLDRAPADDARVSILRAGMGVGC